MIRRIELVMKSQNLTSSQFADKLGVQRSGMSHILSGRNKPSLDFVLKVLAGFPDLNPQWLLQGKGKMYANMAEVVEVRKEENPGAPLPLGGTGHEPGTPAYDKGTGQEPGTPAYDKGESLTDALLNMAPAQMEQEAQTGRDTEQEEREEERDFKEPQKKISRIVLFYNDGTFSEFAPGNEPGNVPDSAPDNFRLD
ncbi:MAG: helix-turn-helix domain-containing protein, partial [Bacteroidales bacterium]|nr:helix-turn-helix domain-containing protein [Bacteroidales bacterium]